MHFSFFVPFFYESAIMKIERKGSFLMKTFFKKSAVLFLTIGALALTGCSSGGDANNDSSAIAYNQTRMSHYDVVKREAKPTIDGVTDDEIWAEVPAISGGFHLPWEDKESPLTVFKAYHDDENMYFSFEVTDEDVLVAKEDTDDENVVDGEDRVEIFIAGKYIDVPGPKGMEPYYGIEIDPKGRVHDYSIIYYRDFDGKWNLDGLETKATQNDKGYVVEGLIPMKFLRDNKLINENNVMNAGVYRAEFSTPKKEGEDPIMSWISWIDPKTENPDYHVASSFGEFRFLK